MRSKKAARGRAPRIALAAAAATCAALLAPAAASATTIDLSASDTVVGGQIELTATLGDAPEATGTIEFEVFGPDDGSCEGPALAPTPAAATVAGEGTYSTSFTTSASGTYRWTARYSGDNPEASSECAATSNVSRATPTIGASASATTIGGAIHDQATVAGGFSPDGEVAFALFGPGDTSCATPLATDTVDLVAGAATSPDFVPSTAGEYRWAATYLGDANNEPVSTACGQTGQTSVVGKAIPTLTGAATAGVDVGQTITDTATVSGGIDPAGDLVFRAYGPGDPGCTGTPAYEEIIAFSGAGSYSPPGFAPAPGAYLWTIEYKGDANNAAVTTACGAENQASAVGVLTVTLSAAASPGGTVGGQLGAVATIASGATPGGQLTFRAYAPGDTACAAPAFVSTVPVGGNNTYASAAFASSRVGTYRWTVAYSGDTNHAPAETACATAAISTTTKATPTIAGKVGGRLTVGARVRDVVTLTGAFAPTGTVTFAIYGPNARNCARPAFVNRVAVNGETTVASDPFVAKRAGRYRFVATYSGDQSNEAATEPCGSLDQLAAIAKRTPKLRPLARLTGPQQITIRARLAATTAPTGTVSFRLFAPGDRRCAAKPAFAGSLRVRRNGTFTLAEYIATEPGVYRLAVAYSGDPRNAATRTSCAGTRRIAVGPA